MSASLFEVQHGPWEWDICSMLRFSFAIDVAMSYKLGGQNGGQHAAFFSSIPGNLNKL